MPTRTRRGTSGRETQKKRRARRIPKYLDKHPELRKYWEMYPYSKRKTADPRKWRAIQAAKKNATGAKRRKPGRT